MSQDSGSPGRQFADAGFFVLRTPSQPIEAFVALGEGLATPACDPGAPEWVDAIERDRRLLATRLRAWASSARVAEALFLASPGLETRVQAWLREPEKWADVERVLVRYLARSSTRPTPFGLFAGCTVGVIGERTRIELATKARDTRRTRLDMSYLGALSTALAQHTAVRDAVRFRPNETLYAIGDRLRYVETRLDGDDRVHHLVSVDRTRAIESILDHASAGATLLELTGRLTASGIASGEAAPFVDALADCGLLVSELQLPLTGEEAHGALLRALEQHPALEALVRPLAAVATALAAIDADPLPTAPARYREIAATLDALPVNPDPGRLFQVDLSRTATQAVLGRRTVATLADAAALLARITPIPEHPLAGFRRAFAARYEDREVPLVEALDPDLGIGFGGPSSRERGVSPLLGKLPFDGVATASVIYTDRDRHLQSLLHALWRSDDRVLTLTQKDIEHLAVDQAVLPDAFAVLASIVPAREAEPEQLIIHSVSGPSGIRLLARFASEDDALATAMRRHLDAEEGLRPEAIFAEVCCQPQDRLGNVIARPVLRDYEIPYLGRSGLPPERQIPVRDLLVSLRNGRIRLRSRKLGREVVPRLSNAHSAINPSNPALYRFLAALQTEGTAGGLSWSWGALEGAPYLPRVTYKALILAPARWHIEAAALDAIRACSGAKRAAALRNLRVSRRLPRHVVLADDDNELVIDLDCPPSAEGLLQLGRKDVVLSEWLAGPAAQIAAGPGSTFANEIVVPFTRVKVEGGGGQPRAATREAPLTALTRAFPPGSDWLYVRIYCGEATADRILLSVVGPTVRQAIDAGIADQWFFLRYADPDPHLRVRLRGDPARLLAETLPMLRDRCGPYLETGFVHRIELGTYDREIERYGGGEGIALAERIFRADSDAALAIVRACPSDAGHDHRWRLALLAIHRLLDDFRFDLPSRLALSTDARDAFAAEFNAGPALRKAIGDQLRSLGSSLTDLLTGRFDRDGALAPGVAALEDRSAAIASAAADYVRLGASGALAIGDIVASLAHMSVNRVIRSEQRAHEYVLWSHLAALYRGEHSRAAGTDAR